MAAYYHQNPINPYAPGPTPASYASTGPGPAGGGSGSGYPHVNGYSAAYVDPINPGPVDPRVVQHIAVEAFGVLSLQPEKTMSLGDFLDELTEYHASSATIDAVLAHMTTNEWVVIFRERGPGGELSEE